MAMYRMLPAGLATGVLWLAGCGSPPAPSSSPSTKTEASAQVVTLKVVMLDELLRERAVERGKVVVLDVWATW